MILKLRSFRSQRGSVLTIFIAQFTHSKFKLKQMTISFSPIKENFLFCLNSNKGHITENKNIKQFYYLSKLSEVV